MSQLRKYITLLYGMSRKAAKQQIYNCHHGKHVTVQMDGFCIYCDAHVDGNPLASPNNPPVLSDEEIYERLRGIQS